MARMAIAVRALFLRWPHRLYFFCQFTHLDTPSSSCSPCASTVNCPKWRFCPTGRTRVFASHKYLQIGGLWRRFSVNRRQPHAPAPSSAAGKPSAWSFVLSGHIFRTISVASVVWLRRNIDGTLPCPSTQPSGAVPGYQCISSIGTKRSLDQPSRTLRTLNRRLGCKSRPDRPRLGVPLVFSRREGHVRQTGSGISWLADSCVFF